MQRIAIFRGQTFVRHIELGAQDLTIGREGESALVLEDPTKAVSRLHAELRFENGQYTLIDLNSRNGVWVNGRRERRWALQSGTPFTIGPYTLMLEPAATDETLTGATSSAGSPVSAEPPPSDTIRAGGGAATPLRPPIAPKTSRRAPTSKPVAPPAPGLIAFLARLPKPVLFGSFSVFVILVVGLGQLVNRDPSQGAPVSVAPVEAPPPQPTTAEQVATHLAEGRAMLERGEFERAIREHFDPALLLDAANSTIEELRNQALSKIAEQTQTVEKPLEPTVSVSTPVAQPAKPPVPKAPLPTVARNDGESVSDWYGRDRQVQAAYDRAKSLLDRSEFAAALAALKELEPAYRDTETLSQQAAEGIRSLARQEFEAAEKLAASSDWLPAIQRYQRAQQIDPAIVGVDAAVTKIRESMRVAGDDAFRRARQFDAAGRVPEATALYERAIQLLPADDTRRNDARTRLDAFKSGLK